MTDDEMVSQVEQFLRDNPPLTTAALRAELAAERARADALTEACTSLGTAEFDEVADALRKAIEARGGKIVWGEKQ